MSDTATDQEGACDLSACTARPHGRMCQCKPKCQVCGFGEHTATHGPHYGQPPGSKPWGHKFRPQVEEHPNG